MKIKYSSVFLPQLLGSKFICFGAIFCFCICCGLYILLAIVIENMSVDDIECKPFLLDRKVLRVSGVSRETHEEIELKRYFHDLQMTHQVVSMDRQGKHFFARNWEPSYSCSVQMRLGCPGDGGKWICDPHIHLQGDKCVVYSFGSNDEFSFETAVHEFNSDCEVYTFDPTVLHPTKKPSFVHYHTWGLGTTDASNKSFTRSYFTLQDIMHRLGHEHVNVLKVDCEGCELDFWTLDMNDGTVDQLQVEVHWGGRLGSPERIHDFFKFLTRKGFAIFNKEPNIQYSDGEAVEFGLVHAFSSAS